MRYEGKFIIGYALGQGGALWGIRATSHMVLKVRDHCILASLIGPKRPRPPKFTSHKKVKIEGPKKVA